MKCHACGSSLMRFASDFGGLVCAACAQPLAWPAKPSPPAAPEGDGAACPEAGDAGGNYSKHDYGSADLGTLIGGRVWT